MSVIFKNRFPEIMAELPVKVDRVVAAGAQLVEIKAKARVPDRPPIGEGLVAAIHTESAGVGEHEVIAGDTEHWYGHLVEHGTTHSAPQPFLVPALEESRDEVVGLIGAVLRSL